MKDIFVRLCDLPTKVRGFVKKTPDGYTIVLVLGNEPEDVLA